MCAPLKVTVEEVRVVPGAGETIGGGKELVVVVPPEEDPPEEEPPEEEPPEEEPPLEPEP